MPALDRVMSLLPEVVREAFQDETVSELMINGPGKYFVERDGGQPVEVAAPGLTAEDLVAAGSLPAAVYEEAAEHLRARRNILIAGGTGSGKTTLLQALAGVIPDDERILVIEDTTEIQLTATNLLQMEARELTGSGLSIRDLVRASLRHRPDRLILGEVRGGEAADLIQALNTGHGGSLSTIHSNDAESALVRLASCALQGSEGISWPVLCMQVAQAIDFVVHVERRDGRRGVSSAVHVLRAQGDGWETRRFWPRPGR